MQALTGSLAIYGLLLVSAGVFLDEAGLPIPSFVLLLLAGAVAYAHPHLVPIVLGTAMAAALAADLLWYGAARRLGRRIQAWVCRLSLSPDASIGRCNELYDRAGPSSLLVVRYLPGLTNITMTRAATSGTPFVRVFLFNLIGIALFYALPLVLGTLFHEPLGRFMNALIAAGWRGVALVLGAMVIYAGGRWWERRISIREHHMRARKLIAMIERRRRREFAIPVAASQSRPEEEAVTGPRELIPG